MKAFYPGTFDPFTVGHLAIVCKSLEQYDELIIGIGVNEDKAAPPLFGQKYRVCLIERALTAFAEEYEHRRLSGRKFSAAEIKAVDKIKNRHAVKVVTFGGMQVDAAYRFGADVIIRGERDSKDREMEHLMALTNEGLGKTRGHHIPTVHIACPEEKYLCVSSSWVKNLCTRLDYVYAASLLPLGIRDAVLVRYLRREFVRLLERFGCDETDYAERAWFNLRQAYASHSFHTLEALAYRLNYLKIYQEEKQKLSDFEYNELEAALFYSYVAEEDSDEAMQKSAAACRELEYFYGTLNCRRINDLILTLRGAEMVKQPDNSRLLNDIILRPLAEPGSYACLALSCCLSAAERNRDYVSGRQVYLQNLLGAKRFQLHCYQRYDSHVADNIKKELSYWQSPE